MCLYSFSNLRYLSGSWLIIILIIFQELFDIHPSLYFLNSLKWIKLNQSCMKWSLIFQYSFKILIFFWNWPRIQYLTSWVWKASILLCLWMYFYHLNSRKVKKFSEEIFYQRCYVSKFAFNTEIPKIKLQIVHEIFLIPLFTWQNSLFERQKIFLERASQDAFEKIRFQTVFWKYLSSFLLSRIRVSQYWYVLVFFFIQRINLKAE